MLADISVIIPAYNRAGLIGETLQSLLNQTVPAKEIIVVDDGSTDGTAETALEILKSGEAEKLKISEGNPWPEFKVIRQDNAGPGAARNRGLAEATGEFIHFFDSDDIAAPNKHEVQLQALLESGVDIAYGPWVKGRFLSAEKLKDFLTTDDTDNHGYQKNKHGNAQGICAGDAFSNPFTSELARDYEKTSPTRSASGPACVLFADHGEIGSAGGKQIADSEEFLEGQLQAGLQMDNQKGPTIRIANDPSAAGEYSSSVPIRDIRGSNFSLPRNFVPEGPILQARGLPHGDLVRALLTKWSIVPHVCLFRRSILEKAGGFPEDIWVGEDQLLFLRCLLAGAKVVHTPETMVYYRLGDDSGKLTATGAAQKRHARDWARFLLKANQEVKEKAEMLKAEKLKKEGTTKDANQHETGKIIDGKIIRTTEEEAGLRLAGQADASESDSLPSRLADSPVSESPTRSASGPASSPATSHSLLATAPEAPSPATSYPLPATTTPSAWFGFRLRAYEAWRDLEKFFPVEENELKNELQGIWKKNWFSGFRFQVSGFVVRKLGGLKLRVLGYRENTSFRCGKFSSFVDFGE